MTLVSVIIPTFNKAPLVCDIVKYLGCQTFKDFEILVVDDGSSDGTIKQIKVLRRNQKGLNIRVFNTGLSDKFGMCRAINLGLENAKGKLIVLVNDDIYLHPNCIQEHVKAQTETGFRYGIIGPRFDTKAHKISRLVPWRSRIWQKHVRAYTIGKMISQYYIYNKDSMVSSNLSMSTDLLCQIGGYNEFFTRYTGAIDRDVYYRLEQVDSTVLYTWWPQAFTVGYGHPLYRQTKWLQDNSLRDGENVSTWKREQMRYSQKMELQAQEQLPPVINRG